MINWEIYKLDSMDQELDEALVNRLLFDVFISHEYAMKDLPDEETVKRIIKSDKGELLTPFERDEGDVSAIINSIVTKIYYDKEKQNYLYIASDLLDRLANKHAFYDGNKRTALYSAFVVLNTGLNIHINFSFDEAKYIDELLLIVKNKQQGISDDERINQIEGFLNEIVLENLN